MFRPLCEVKKAKPDSGSIPLSGFRVFGDVIRARTAGLYGVIS
jgi:hypothetical protein